MLKQTSLRLLSADEIALVAGGADEDEIIVTGSRVTQDNKSLDFGGRLGGGSSFPYDFRWLIGYGERFGDGSAATDSDGDGIPDNVDPDPDVVDIVVTVTQQQVVAMQNAFERATGEVSLLLASGHIGNAAASSKLGISGAAIGEGIIQIADANTAALIAARAAHLYQTDGADGVYDGESAHDRLMGNGLYMALSYVVH
jgi:hypothetical protein